MTTTVDAIAKAAFDAVAAGITDAVLDGTLNDGSTDYTGRVVLGGETAPGGWPMAVAKEKVRPAYLEGYSAVAGAGWTLVASGVTYYVLGVRDIVQAGGFQVANVIASADMLWQSVTFQRATNASDGAGGHARTWATLATRDAGLVALSGDEQWRSARLEAQSQWRAVCLPVSGLREGDRVQIGSRTYNITFVNDVEQRGIWQVLDLALGEAT